MEHLTVKAVATATEMGWFTAIAAVFGNIDRDGDRIVKGAFAESIEAWQSTGRTVPLHWNHSADPDDIVGHVLPGSMVETDQGLVVEGQLDFEGSERARQAWRAMKTGRIGLPFGYLTQRQRKAADGTNELLAIDLLEIGLTPGSSNPSTAVLNMKSREAVAKASALRTLERLSRSRRRQKVPPMPEGWYPHEPGDPFYEVDWVFLHENPQILQRHWEAAWREAWL